MDHRPVLAGETRDLLLPALEEGGVVVDGTLGRGGHARLILDSAPHAELVGIDRDGEALHACRTNLAAYSDRVRFVRDDFAQLATVLERLGIEAVRGVLLDLGVSSPQLDEAHRGFSFRGDGPLDMRMDASQPLSAADVVNTYEVDRLSDVIRRYGEERFARRIARAIEHARPIERTARLAEVIAAAVPAASRRTGGHPARRTFQALRIEVNDELGQLERTLPQIVDALEPGGRAVIISYHSLEDRAVKRFFRDEAAGCVCPPDFPVCNCGASASLRVITRTPVRPRSEEIERNPRASAAKLRCAERVSAEVALPPGEETERKSP